MNTYKEALERFPPGSYVSFLTSSNERKAGILFHPEQSELLDILGESLGVPLVILADGNRSTDTWDSFDEHDLGEIRQAYAKSTDNFRLIRPILGFEHAVMCGTLTGLRPNNDSYCHYGLTRYAGDTVEMTIVSQDVTFGLKETDPHRTVYYTTIANFDTFTYSTVPIFKVKHSSDDTPARFDFDCRPVQDIHAKLRSGV